MLRKSPHLFLVLLIEGGALMAVELMGAKLVAPFYGNSLYVWTAVLTISVLGLTLGYYAGGRLSKNGASETNLFVVLGISAALVLMLPFTATISMSLTKGLDLIMGICVTCVLLLLPPMFCFGIVGPMVVSLMSSQLETVGKTAGTVYFTSTLGGIAVTFLLGLYLIPVAGLKLCATATGLALAALPLIYILKRFLSGRASPESSAFVRPQRDKPIPATNKRTKIPNKKLEFKGERSSVSRPPMIRRTIYLFAVLEGATVMAVELLSARMVAPYFGSALYAWGTVIGFTLLALAIGYFAGGVIADKYSGPDTLLWLLLTASLFLILMHVSAPLLTIAFANLSPSVAVVLVSMALILPPLVFLGMVPTFLIRRVSTTGDSAGRSTGTVYAISSASGIFALPVFGFFIIPRFGLTLPSIMTGLVVGMIPFVKLVGQKRYVSLLWIPFALFSFWAIKTQHPGKAVDVKYYSEGLLGQLLVADISSEPGQKSGQRMLMMNRMVQTWVNTENHQSIWDYVGYVRAICSNLPKKADALILGLGGGTVANIFAVDLGYNVDAVELDQRIVDVARDYFALSNRVNVIVDDARHYLEESEKKYDLIFFDVYRGEIPPSHVFTVESLITTKKLLKEDGLIVVNFNGFLDGKTGRAARSIYKTLIATGLETAILPTPGPEPNRNLLFVAAKRKEDLRTAPPQFIRNGSEVDIDALFLDPRKLDLSDAVVLSDNKPILELLNIPAGNAWREAYVEMTRSFYKQGVTLFR